ncbi:MAG: hypothetical protein WD883_03185 [Candidatus Colwellbacteria bacterium]
MVKPQKVEVKSKDKSLSGMRELLNKAFVLYKKYFWDLVSLQLIQLALVLGLGFLMSAGFGGLGMLVAGLLVLIATVTISIAMIYVVHSRKGIMEAMRSAFGNLRSYVWLIILSTLIVTGATVLLIVPGIIFGVWFVLAIYVFVVEDKRGLAALFTSKAYIRGYWWPVFGRLLLLAGLSLSISLVVGFVASFGDIMAREQIAQVLTYSMDVLFTPFVVTYLYMLYKSVKVVKPKMKDEDSLQKHRWVFIGAGILGLIAWLLVFATAAIMYTAFGPISDDFSDFEGVGPIEIDPGQMEGFNVPQ